MQVNVPVTDMTLVVDSVIVIVRAHVIHLNAHVTDMTLVAHSVTVTVHVVATVASVVVMDTMQVALVNVILTWRALVIHLSVHVMDMLRQLVLVIPLVNV